jgi:hypothetical protein
MVSSPGDRGGHPDARHAVIAFRGALDSFQVVNAL